MESAGMGNPLEGLIAPSSSCHNTLNGYNLQLFGTNAQGKLVKLADSAEVSLTIGKNSFA
jgi:hypothetical protein